MRSLPAIREKQFQAQVEELAGLLGWRYYHPFDSRKSKEGYPDLTMVRRTRLIFAELKVEGYGPTPAQEVWLEELRHTGAETYLWYPADLPGIVKVLT